MVLYGISASVSITELNVCLYHPTSSQKISSLSLSSNFIQHWAVQNELCQIANKRIVPKQLWTKHRAPPSFFESFDGFRPKDDSTWCLLMTNGYSHDIQGEQSAKSVAHERIFFTLSSFSSLGSFWFPVVNSSCRVWERFYQIWRESKILPYRPQSSTPWRPKHPSSDGC